uniref:Uncharacterized protein n=1 Tax=Anopheles dirus TaxID=7168 RepID=A0A182NX21_9DIPT
MGTKYIRKYLRGNECLGLAKRHRERESRMMFCERLNDFPTPKMHRSPMPARTTAVSCCRNGMPNKCFPTVSIANKRGIRLGANLFISSTVVCRTVARNWWDAISWLER